MPLPELTTSLPLENYATPTSPQACEQVLRPGVQAFQRWLLENMGSHLGAKGGILRDCSRQPLSDHHEGRAYDWPMLASDSDEAARVDEVLDWLLKPDDQGNEHVNLRRIGLTYIIWNRQIWHVSTKEWRPYNKDPHIDHVHFSFGWPGAMGETSFFEWVKNPNPVPPPPPVEPEEPGDPWLPMLAMGGALVVVLALTYRWWK